MMDYYVCSRFSAIILSLLILSDAYNVEERKFGTAKGKEGSQFGYTVAMVPSPGWKSNKNIFKNKTLLVGAPNETYNGIRGHGLLYECSKIMTEMGNCKLLNTSGTSKLCDKIRRGDKKRSACEEDSRFGSSLAVNRYYIENENTSHYNTIPMVTACAPGWKNPIQETDPKNYLSFIVGKCIKLTDDLKTIPCTNDGQFGKTISPVSSDGCLQTLHDGYDIVGGPGVYDWRGAFTSPKKKWTVFKNSSFPHTTYFGYDLKAAKLSMDADILVGAPNFYKNGVHGHFGQVLVYKGTVKVATIVYGHYYECPVNDFNRMRRDDFEKLVKTNQNGNKFGAVIESLDLNGDGLDEVLVAAPLYTGEHPDEGRVFVYTSTVTGVCGPIAVLSGGSRKLSLKEKTEFARFGTCISSIGDIDNDHFKDVAIGAPYEDNGAGAVYIYNGVSDLYIQDQFSQRIAGEAVDPGIRTFGWSIYGNEDIDNNGFPDIVVGAYQSDTVVVLRTRPVVSVNFDVTIDPSPIPLDSSLQNCSSYTSMLCFNVHAKFSFTTLGPKDDYVKNMPVLLTMRADTLYLAREDTSRVVFLETNSSNILTNVTLKHDDITDESIPLLVLGNPEPRDVWTKVRVEGSFEILESADTDFDVIDPVLYRENLTHRIIDVKFDNKCDKVGGCTSDLRVKLDTVIIGKNHVKYVDNKTEIYVGEANELMIAVDVRSENGTSYDTIFTSNASANLIRPISPDHGIIGALCEITNASNTSEYTQIMCAAKSSLFLPRNIKVKIYYDISSQALLPNNDLDRMKEVFQIEIEAEQQNPDVDIDNNIFEVLIPIKLKHNVVIQEDDNVEDQIYYEDDVESERRLSMIQRYYLSNRGPSFLHLTNVNITVPVMKHGIQIAIIKNISNICTERESTDNTSQLYRDEELVKGKEVLKEVNDRAANNEATENDISGNMKIINCLDETYDCTVIECKLIDMEPGKQEVIEFTVDIYEKELANEKSDYGIRYATFADVTDPYTYYGGKSVKWTKPVYAQKWTAFVHEQSMSAVPKVELWIIILSGIGGLILLAVIVVVLWKCNFFERKKHYQILDWKARSENNTTLQEKEAEAQ